MPLAITGILGALTRAAKNNSAFITADRYVFVPFYNRFIVLKTKVLFAL